MDFPTTFMAPVVETIEGTRVTFPLLRVPELAPIAAEIRADNLEAVERALDASDRITRLKNPAAEGITATQRYRARMEVETEEFSTFRVIDRIKTPAGARCVLKVSLEKEYLTPGLTDELVAKRRASIEAILDALDLVETTNLAMRVSRVTRPKPPAPPKPPADGKAEPPEVRPLDVQPDPSGTGSST